MWTNFHDIIIQTATPIVNICTGNVWHRNCNFFMNRGGSTFCCCPLITYQQGQSGLSTVGVAHLFTVDRLGWVCYFSSSCSSKKNSSSNFLSSAIHKIRANLAVGLNCPVSIELTVFLDTPNHFSYHYPITFIKSLNR